jgi:hypothetical protein
MPAATTLPESKTDVYVEIPSLVFPIINEIDQS